jgi:hypothetical protein
MCDKPTFPPVQPKSSDASGSERREGEYIAEWLHRVRGEEIARETERKLLDCGPCGLPEHDAVCGSCGEPIEFYKVCRIALDDDGGFEDGTLRDGMRGFTGSKP